MTDQFGWIQIKAAAQQPLNEFRRLCNDGAER
jgi:hypothetical protein